jgi:RHS repeat-associated protein
VTDRASYGVYGELLSRTGTTNTPFLFNGKWGVQTDASGMPYHRARYYHPQLRRFLNQDTVLGSIGTHAGMNRFAYANGQPVTGIDPLGLSNDDSMTAMATVGLLNGSFGPMHAYGSALAVNAQKHGCDDGPNSTATPATATTTTGTDAVRLNFTGANHVVGWNGTVAIVKDSHGTWDLQVSSGYAANFIEPAASLTLGYTHTNAKAVDDLTGLQGQFGLAGGRAGLGGEVNYIKSGYYSGFDIGFGLSTPGQSPQFTLSETWSLRRDVIDMATAVKNFMQPIPTWPPKE